MTVEKILLVEDDAILAMHIHDLLESKGYAVLPPVPSGEAALQAAKMERPALVLMDIELAGEMNGITAAEQLAAETDIPVVFLSGYSEEVLLQQAKIAAPYGYLVKPVPERELVATIEMTLHRHHLDMQVKHSEARYRALVEQASDGIYVIDQQGNYLEVNAAGCDMVGYTREEMLQLNIRDLVQPEALEKIPHTIQKMLNGEIARFETGLICKNGELIIVEISGKMLDDGNLQGIVRDISDRIKTNQLLRMQSAALNAAVNAIVITDVNGIIQWANPAFITMTGYSLEEALGKNPRDLVKSGNHPTSFYKKMWETILAGQVWQGEMINRRKDGSQYTEEMTLTPLTDSNGQVVQFIAIKQDVTERKLVEEKRREIEEKFTKIFQIVPDAVAISRLHDGRYLDVNQGFLDYLGFSRKEVIGKTSSELHIFVQEQVRNIAIQNLMKNNILLNYEISLQTKNGCFKTCLMSAKTMELDGETCLLSIARDITELKLAQQEIERARDYYLTLLEEFPALIWRSNTEGKCDYFNHTWLRFTGRTLGQELYDGWAEGVHPEDRQACIEKYLKAFQTRKSFTMDYRLRNFAGEYRWIVDNGQPFYNLEGEFAGYLGVCYDITERRNMEEDLRATHGFLEALLENMPLMASVMDEDGRLLRVNHAWEEFLETNRQQALGKDISKYTPPKTAKKIKQANQAVLSSLTPQNLEVELFNKNKAHQLSAVKFPVPRKDGRIAVGTVLIDVTEDRNTRKGLEQNLVDLQALYQASQTFTLLQDEKSLVASVSRNAVSFFESVDIAWVELLGERNGARSVQKIFQRSRKYPREVSLTHPLLLWRQQFANMPLDCTVVLEHLDEKVLTGNLKDCVREMAICTLACLPLMHGAQCIGWLHIASRQPDAFGSDERRYLLESYANHAATALSNARLYRANSQQVREMTVIHQISYRLQKLTTQTELAQEIIRALEILMEFDNCAVFLRDRETDALIPYAAKMKADDEVSEAEHLRRLSEADLRIGKGITGWVVQHGHSEKLDDAHSDPRFIAVNQKTKSEICAPLLVGERVFGVVNVESSQLAAYSDHDLSILETLAGQIAVAVQNVQLFQSLQEGNERLRELNTRLEEVEEAERKRLAHELHDQVGQNLSAINLSLNLIRSQLLPEQNATLGARVDDSLGLLEETVQRIRSVMTELRPSILDDYGLPAALRWLGEQFAWRTGVQVEIDDQVGERLLTPIQETALFRISQETLANISKHAAAEHVRIVIQKCANGDCFCLIIEDDGIGFSNDTKLDKSNSSGWGVNIMRERAVAIGGKLWINTTPLTGTRVVVEVPLQGEENDHSGIVG